MYVASGTNGENGIVQLIKEEDKYS